MANKRRRVSQCKNSACDGKYILTYESSAPIFICEKCGDKEVTWQKFYNEYLGLFRVRQNWDEKKNYVSCALGFFCYLYKDFYGVDYVFVPKNPNPYGCKECKDAWQLLAAFGGDAHAVRKYIYWVFRKSIKRSTNLVSFNYLNAPGLIRRYILNVKKKETVSRETKLSKDFTNWCLENTPKIFDKYELSTMNDLGALLSYTSCYETPEDSDEKKLLNKAEIMGYVKDGKLNLGIKNNA